MGKFINPFTDEGFKRIFGQENVETGASHVPQLAAEGRAQDCQRAVPRQGLS